MEYLKKLEENNEITPWVQEIISKHAGDIHSKFEEIFSNKDLVRLV